MKKKDKVRILNDWYGYKKGDIGVVVDVNKPVNLAHVFVEGRESTSGLAPNVSFHIDSLELIPTSITEEIQQLEKRLAELKAMQENKRFVPEYGDEYYYLNSVLAVIENDNDGSYAASTHIHTHNCFCTEAEAEQRAKTISKKYDIINRIEELNEGWKPDWEDGEQLKESIVEINGEFKVRAGSVEKLHSDALYFKSAPIGFRIIKEFGDELGCLFEV